MERGLVLRRETLAALSDGDLGAVAGGTYSAALTCGVSCAVRTCLEALTETTRYTDHVRTLEPAECPSLGC
ncbi:MAG TPA: hypothetical protein VGX28_12550 [Frankiaceae bacterium]|jgi:acyl-coenzyme A thioesterase PaaI-like protein|nr:hypothetical protein [Frankiaceae bacterium]